MTRDSAEWIERLNKAGVPAGPIYAMDQVFADPQVRHLGIAQPVEHPDARPPRTGRPGGDAEPHAEPAQHRQPRPGEHTDAILRELGYSDADIAGLRERRSSEQLGAVQHAAR